MNFIFSDSPGAECSQSNTYAITNQKGSNPLFFPAPTHLPNCGPMIKFMSQEDQDAIAKAEATGNFDDPAYLAANERFMLLHAAGVPKDTDPECLRRPKKIGTDSYITAWGPNEYTPIGNLSNYEYRDKLKNIKEPALIINGTNDLCTPLVAKTMYDSIPNSRWELFDDCRHACFVEDTDRYCRLLNEWMEQND